MQTTTKAQHSASYGAEAQGKPNYSAKTQADAKCNAKTSYDTQMSGSTNVREVGLSLTQAIAIILSAMLAIMPAMATFNETDCYATNTFGFCYLIALVIFGRTAAGRKFGRLVRLANERVFGRYAQHQTKF